MSIASDFLERHIQTLVSHPVQWRTLIADDIVWKLAYPPAIGHPARLAGRAEVTRHVDWSRCCERLSFHRTEVHAFATPSSGGASQGEATISRPGASIAKISGVPARKGDKFAHLRE